MVIDMRKIKDELWLNAKLYNNIAYAYILPIKERKPDVDIVEIDNLIGLSSNISIDKLIKDYTYINGKNISAFGLRNGKRILVRQKNTESNTYQFIYIPSGNVIIYEDGTEDELNNSVYLIYSDTGISQISPIEFRKMFQVIDNYRDNSLYDTVINKRSKNTVDKQESSSRSILEMLKKRKQMSTNSNKNTTDSNNSDNIFSIFNNCEQVDMLGSNSDNKETINIKNVNLSKSGYTREVYMDIPNNYTYSLVQMVVIDRNIKGFIISNGEDTKEVGKKDFIKLVKSGDVNNVGIKNKDGTYKLYGIGCKLSDIPKINR